MNSSTRSASLYTTIVKVRGDSKTVEVCVSCCVGPSRISYHVFKQHVRNGDLQMDNFFFTSPGTVRVTINDNGEITSENLMLAKITPYQVEFIGQEYEKIFCGKANERVW